LPFLNFVNLTTQKSIVPSRELDQHILDGKLPIIMLKITLSPVQ